MTPFWMKKIVAIMSGKGGVGKSTTASIIACIASEKYKTLLLDFDICGPSIKNIFDTNEKVVKQAKGLKGIQIKENLDFLSMGLLIKSNDSVIWRGPKKLSILNMFFESIDEYEFVVIDLPPGLTEEHHFLVDKNVQVIFVTTPQNMALSDTEATIKFCVENDIKIVGLIENMSGYKCEKCNCNVNLFAKNGGILLANEYNIKFICSFELNKNVSDIIENQELSGRYNEFENIDLLRSIIHTL